jgi:formylglycine-generating enzyme required for sulfatase activity
MSERELLRFCARLARDPDDRDARRGVLRLVQRTGQVPTHEARAPVMEVLLEGLERDPGDRIAAEVALALVGLRPEVGRAPRFWEAQARWAGEVTAPRDGRTGLPLWVRRRRDGARMVLVSGGLGVRGRWGRTEEEPPHAVNLDPFYIDVTPRIPEGGVTFAEAQALAARAGGRLPTEAELERAWRGLEGADHPWEGSRPGPDEGLVSPFGLVDPPGRCWLWCADVYHPEAYSVSVTRNSWRGEPWEDPRGLRRVVRAASPPGGASPEPCTRRFGRDPEDKDPFLGLRVVFSLGAEPTALPVPGGPLALPLEEHQALVLERRWWEVRRETRSRSRDQGRRRREPQRDPPPQAPRPRPSDPPRGGGGLLGALGRLARGLGQVLQPGVSGARRSTSTSTRTRTTVRTPTRSVTPRSTPRVRTPTFRPPRPKKT